MKKIVLLVFACLFSGNALAVVGGVTTCANYTDMASCNSTTDALDCYYGYTRKTSGGLLSYMCYDCTNTSLEDDILISSQTEVQPTISRLNAKTEYIQNGVNYPMGNTYGFCPVLVTCPAGYGLKLYKNPNCNSLSTTADCREHVACIQCGSATYDKETKLVRMSAAGTLKDEGMFYVEGTKMDADNNTVLVLNAMSMTDNSVYGCGICGANATVNADGNNCDCIDGYVYYDANGTAHTQLVDDNNCEERRYKISLRTEDCISSDGCSYIQFRSSDGYDLDLDGTYGDDGTNLNMVVNVKLPKKQFLGWSFWEPSNKMCSQNLIWTDNQVAGNIVDICNNASNGDCTCNIDTANDSIALYKIWAWKTYTVVYNDNSDEQETCKYNSDCILNYEPNKTAPAGKLFDCWEYGENCLKVGDNIKTLEPALSEFISNKVTLTPRYIDCPAGYYCTNNGEQACPAGTTSNTGAGAKTDCHISAETKFKDSDSDFTLPLNDVYIK